MLLHLNKNEKSYCIDAFESGWVYGRYINYSSVNPNLKPVMYRDSSEQPIWLMFQALHMISNLEHLWLIITMTNHPTDLLFYEAPE